jgi:hypothetical protein
MGRPGNMPSGTAPAQQPQPGYTIRKKDRNWTVLDPQGRLVCLTV